MRRSHALSLPEAQLRRLEASAQEWRVALRRRWAASSAWQLLVYVTSTAAWEYPEVAVEIDEVGRHSEFAWRSRLTRLGALFIRPVGL